MDMKPDLSHSEKSIDSVSKMVWRKLRSVRVEVTGGWEKLLNEELHNLYCSPN
jgi:hypothetical protein